MRPALLLILGLAACTGPAPAPGVPDESVPDPSTLGGDLNPLAEPTAFAARFLDARALGADASGRLYVADAGAAHVVVFEPDGRAQAVMGGPGTTDESLVEPVAVEPTNGLAVYVADAGTGRVVRFTAERRAAEAIPIQDYSGRTALGSRPDEARGRPVGVAAGPGNALFVAEARRGVVLVFDRDRRVERTIGGPDAGAAALRRPTALAADDRGRLFVLDGGVVRTYDAFGSPGAPLPDAGVGDLRGVSVSGGAVVVAGARGAALFRDGARVAAFASAVPLVDAAVVGGWVVGLSRDRLVRLGEAP